MRALFAVATGWLGSRRFTAFVVSSRSVYQSRTSLPFGYQRFTSLPKSHMRTAGWRRYPSTRCITSSLNCSRTRGSPASLCMGPWWPMMTMMPYRWHSSRNFVMAGMLPVAFVMRMVLTPIFFMSARSFW